MTGLLAPGRVAELAAQPLTYPEVGATAGALPEGYHVQRLRSPVGVGSDQFAAAADALLGWRVHEQAGLRPLVSDLRVRLGALAVLRLGVGRWALTVPLRVVRVVDERDRQGFAYGTLPGHPERGEESFVVERAGDGTVFFALRAFSRPGRWFTVLGGPVARAGQLLVTERYLAAVRSAARSGSGGA